MTAAPRPAASPWEEAGRAVASLADGFGAIVLVGPDADATAEAALGIGREQARRRRVALVDLVGDVRPLRSLVHDEDAHGVVDSFTYGVSLNRIARQVDEIGNLYVMPSGTEPLDHGEILRSGRWRRLASGFREVGALLLLVAPAGAEGLDALVAATDGAIVVGRDVDLGLPVATVLGSVTATRTTRPMAPPEEVEAEPATVQASGREGAAGLDAAAAPASAAPSDDAVAELRARRSEPFTAPTSPRDNWIVPAIVAAIAVGALAIGAWFVTREDGTAEPTRQALVRDTVAPVAPAPRDTAPMIAVANPGDSAAAIAWTVEIIKANTEAGATLKVRDDLADTPGATWSPVVLAGDSVRWYRVTAGTFAARSGADSLLRSLRAKGLVAAGGGDVIRAPFSLVLEPSVARDSARMLVERWNTRGVPALAVNAEPGRVAVVAGLFETPEQAAVLATTLQAAGVEPAVVYRTGRVF